MIGHPLADPLRAEVPVEGGAAIQVVVLRWIRKLDRIPGVGGLNQGLDGVGEVELGVEPAVGSSVDKEAATCGVRGGGVCGECAGDDDSCVDAAKSPVGEDRDAGDCGGFSGGSVFAGVGGVAEHVEGFGSQADDGEGSGATAVGGHKYEAVGAGADGVEGSLQSPVSEQLVYLQR